MSCSTCLESEKVFLDCVYDAENKSLRDTLKEIKEDISKLSTIVEPSIDGKFIKDAKTIPEYIQAIINKLDLLSKNLEKENILDTKIMIYEYSSTPISIESLLKDLTKKVLSFEKSKSNNLYTP